MSLDFGSSGKGGPVHRYWQSIVCLHAKNAGYNAVIEEPISGSKETVDIGLRKDDKQIAIEICITTHAEHELGNCKKCIESGYTKVVSLFLDENKMKGFEELIRGHFTEEELSKISTGLLYDFCRFF